MRKTGRWFGTSTAFAISLVSSACSSDGNMTAGGDAGGPGSGDGDAGVGLVDPDGGGEPPVEIAVCATGGAEHSTIGAAIAAAPVGAVISVCPGTYHERLKVVDKPLTIRGIEGPVRTILDADGEGVALTVRGTTNTGLRVEGFTIRGGVNNGAGGGVRCEVSGLRLIGDIVGGNRAGSGGGFYASGCDLEVDGTTFVENDGDERGGGALLVDTSGEVSSSSFLANQAVFGAGVAVMGGSVLLRENLMKDNRAALRGGGLYHASDAPVEDNVFADNEAGWTGGGVHIVEHAPILRGNQVRGNWAENDGGGIYVHQGTASILDGVVENNRSGDDGGGIRLFTSRARVEGNRITGNVTADGGGGIRVSHEPSLIVDNEIRDNEATFGGGIDMDNDSSVIRGGVIEGNVAWRGGGISGMLFPWRGATIEGVRIAGNRAGYGGGIYLENNFQPVALRDVELVGNDADQGGGVFVRATDVTIRNSTFAGNQGDVEGGGLYVGEPEPWGTPSECPCPPTSPSIEVDFVVFHQNRAGYGSAVWTDTGGLSIGSSILSDNDGMAVVALGPAPGWTYNDTVPSEFAGMTNPTGSAGNISADPQYANSESFALRAGSPCVNAGDPAYQDPDGTRADMGRLGGPEAP